MLERGEVVLNYGLWNMFRTQSKDATTYFTDPTSVKLDPSSPGNANTFALETRGAFAYTVDAWGKLQWKGLTIEAEAVFQYGQWVMTGLNGLNSATKIYARQAGGALDARYDILPELYVR